MEEYTNRELGIMLQEFKDDTAKALTRIEIQTTKTNGSVLKLQFREKLLIGGWIVTTALIPIILGLAMYIVKDYKRDIDNSVDLKINMAIEAYDQKNFQK